MPPMTAKHYVPILKGKYGEFQALQNLESATKEALTPLVEVVPIPWDYKKKKPAKTIDGHLATLPSRIQNAWGTERPLLFDGFNVEDETTGKGLDPLTHLFNACRQAGVSLVPVTGLDRNPQYQTAVARAIAADHLGCCLRITSSDWPGGSFPSSAVTRLLKHVRAKPSDTDLLIDLGPIGEGHVDTFVLLARTLLQAVPKPNQWRSLILAGSAFPFFLTDVRQNSISSTPRAEWKMWDNLVTKKPGLSRLPTFGDYAIAHPGLPDLDFRLIIMIPNIRYTCKEDWLIVRGKNPKKSKGPQYRALCQALIQQGQWQGESHCWGDNFIQQCTSKQGRPGNATTWRAVGTNHHLTFVADQIANHPAV